MVVEYIYVIRSVFALLQVLVLSRYRGATVSTQFQDDLSLDGTEHPMMKIDCEIRFIIFVLNCKLFLRLILNFICFIIIYKLT